jgi:glycosyltransferase involved in cell wall biosynthesis
VKIGFDISQTGNDKAGCGYFADSLIQQLAAGNDRDRYFLYSAFGMTFWNPKHDEETRRIAKDNFTHLLDELSHQETLHFWDNSTPVDEERLGMPDVIHSNNFSCPRLKNARLVYTLYDLAFIDYPDFSLEENRFNCFNGVFNAAMRADLIVAISEYSRRRFLQIFPHYPVERMRVIYLGSRFENVDAETPIADLESNSFWLSVGTLEPRKNLRQTLRAYKQYIDSYADPKALVLVGGQGWLETDLDRFIAELELGDRIRKLGYVDDATLKWLYKNCWAFIYPSLYEGFGLPVLEAMSLGAAVITSNVTSLSEVGGEAVLYVNPTQETEIVDAFAKLKDGQLRERLKAIAPKQASQFSWQKTAAKTLQAYEDVLKLPKKLC